MSGYDAPYGSNLRVMSGYDAPYGSSYCGGSKPGPDDMYVIPERAHS